MLDLFQSLVVAVTTFFVIVSAPLVSTPPTQTPSPHVYQQANITVIKNSYFYQGFSVNVILEIPNSGGKIKGQVDGACVGNIDGTYAGGEGGEIKGKAFGTCSILFIKRDAEADYTGKLYPSRKEAEINYTGKAGDLSHSGTLNLTY